MTAGSAAQSESERSRERAEDLRRRAERLDRRAEAFEQGRAGEVAVSAALARLIPAGYALVDDVRWPGTQKANIDHLVYGPAGMFVVDAKNWTGNVAVKAGVLRQNGYGRTRETDKVAEMTAQMQSALGASVGDLTAILCLVGQPTLPPQRCGRTLVVGTDGLAAWIFNRREIWPAEHVAALTAWLPHVLQPAVAGAGRVQIASGGVAAPAVAATGSTAAAASRSPRPSADVRPQGRHRAPEGAGLYGWLRGR
jgi:hypothetical protein